MTWLEEKAFYFKSTFFCNFLGTQMPTIVSEILFHVTQAVLQLYSSISLVQNAQNALWGGGERCLRAREAAHSEKMPPDRVLCFEDSDTIGSVPRGDQILGT
jgi:hypothetical protein